MIAGALLAAATEYDRQSFAIIGPTGRWTYSELANTTAGLADIIQEVGEARVGIWCDDVPTFVALLAALDSLGIDAVVFSSSFSPEQVRRWAKDLDLARVLTDKSAIPASIASDAVQFQRVEPPRDPENVPLQSAERTARVVLFTSGTSGRPKPAVHTWETLATGVHRDSKYRGKRWLLAYDPTSFAGIQVWLQALLTGGAICVPTSRDPAAAAQLLVQEKVEYVSATPSFWRLLLHSVPQDELKTACLKQITLGGEPVDQTVLDALHAAFPDARITQIYASTEMGVCFSVNDGQAGFPSSYLADTKLPCALRIGGEGELEIQSLRAMQGYCDGQNGQTTTDLQDPDSPPHWFATGDLVERRGDRVFFVGRKSETINVGGMKVFPADVEKCICSVPGVEQVRVFGVSSSITGQLVGADVEPTAGLKHESLEKEILNTCRKQLARHAVPSRITFHEHLPLNRSGKLSRAEVGRD